MPKYHLVDDWTLRGICPRKQSQGGLTDQAHVRLHMRPQLNRYRLRSIVARRVYSPIIASGAAGVMARLDGQRFERTD